MKSGSLLRKTGVALWALSLLGCPPSLFAQYSELFFNDPDPERVSGMDLQQDAIYRFEEVTTTAGVDALLQITTLENGASLGRIDDHGETSPTDMFYPQLSGNPTLNPSVTFTMSFVDSGNGDAPVALDFRWTIADIDSSGTGGVDDIYEVGVLHGISTYTLEGDPANPTNLSPTNLDADSVSFSSFPIIENFTGVDLTDTEVIVLTDYANTSTFSFGFGLTGNLTSSTRNVAASGDPLVFDNFSVPETIPEPSPTILLAVGLVSLLLGRTRKR